MHLIKYKFPINKINNYKFMSSIHIYPLQSSEFGLKSLPLSTLTDNRTPNPGFGNTNPNLNKFRTVQIAQKIRQKLISKNQGKYKRNQSMDNVIQGKNNPQKHQVLFNQIQLFKGTHQKNKQSISQAKAKKSVSFLYGSKNHSKNASTQKLDMTLPLIQPRKRSISTKKANYMQFWLDEALDPQDSHQRSLEQSSKQQEQRQRLKMQLEINKTENTSLSAIKKYKMDKQYLKSQNIPPEIIQRIYSTLYIYTHGISNIFTELLSLVKISTQQQVQDSCILDNFWKSFIKLLQGCTSFQTTFQKVQKSYLIKIGQLREFIQKIQGIFTKQRSELEQKIHKLQKQVLQLNSKYSKLQNQNKVTASTLQLTDHTLNQQVQLRLKFQQKINHVYTSHEQLKTKYKAMIQNLSLKTYQSMEKANIQTYLKQKVTQQQVALLQYKYLLQQQKVKVKQRQQEINIKRQQLQDLKKENRHRVQKQKQEEDEMKTQVDRFGLLKTKVQSLQNRTCLMDRTGKQMQIRIKQQNQAIQNYRRLNQQLHQKLNQTSKNIAQYQSHKIYQQSQITRLSCQLSISLSKLQISQQTINSHQLIIQQHRQQLQSKSYEIQVKNNAIQKINHTIGDLKAVKDKHQRLFRIIQKEKEELQREKNEIQEKYSLEKQEIVGLRMLKQSREKYISEIQSKHDKQKELLKRKITGHNQMLTKKQSLILNYQQNQQNKDTQLLNRTYRIQKLQQLLSNQEAATQRKTKEAEFLFKRIEGVEKQLKNVSQQLKNKGSELYTRLKQHDLSKEQLESVRHLLNIIKNEQSTSITNLTTLYEEYRVLINRKGQHIHPMLYQDLCIQLNRVKLQTVPRLQNKFLLLQQEMLKLAQENKDLQATLMHKSGFISQLQLQIRSNRQSIHTNLAQISTLDNSLLKLEWVIVQRTNQIKSLQQKVSSSQAQICTLSSKLQRSQIQIQRSSSVISLKQSQIRKLDNLIGILSDKVLEFQEQSQVKQRKNAELAKIQMLQRQLQTLNRGMIRVQQQVQTDEQRQVIIVSNASPHKFDRKSKFTNNNSSKLVDRQVQVTLPPYDSIPHYIDSKISAIKKYQLSRDQKSQSPISSVMRSKQEAEQLIDTNRALSRVSSPKALLTRREQLRKALRITYIRK